MSEGDGVGTVARAGGGLAELQPSVEKAPEKCVVYYTLLP
jgi:hypothetical protein